MLKITLNSKRCISYHYREMEKMNLLAGSLFLFAFMAFASGETCSEVITCLSYIQGLQSAAETGNVTRKCELQKKMVDCFSSAVADCQSSGSTPPQSQLAELQTQLAQAKEEYEKSCVNSGGNTGGGDGGMTYSTVPETVTCMEIDKCAFDMTDLQNALSENRPKDACSLIIPSAKCMKSAFSDCKENNYLPEDQLNGISQQITQIDSLVGQHCGDGLMVSVESANGNSVDNMKSVSCMDAMTCEPDSTALMDAITNGRHQEACTIIRTSYNCIKSAVEDCKAKDILSGEALKLIEDNYKGYEQQMTQYCQSTTGEVHCMDSTSCLADTNKLADAVTNSRFQEACQILTTSNNCLQSAVQDCKARGVMSETDIQSMEQLQKSYQPQIQQMCQSTGSNTGGVSCFQMQTCMPDDASASKLNKSMANNQYEEACKIMKPSIECQLSAAEDCRKRGVLDSSSLQEMEKSLAFAQGQMKKYCSSGNSSSTSMFLIFLATLTVILMNFVNFKM